MPLGRTHEKLNIAYTLTVSALFPTGLVFIGGASVGTALVATIPVTLGAALSIVITPDLLDVDDDPLPEKRIRTVPILGAFYAWVFDVVSVRIPHRGFPSHGFYFWIGSLLSLLLLSPVSWLLFVPGFLIPSIWWGFGVVLGKMGGDAVHAITDELVTRFKHRRTKILKWLKLTII